MHMPPSGNLMPIPYTIVHDGKPIGMIDGTFREVQRTERPGVSTSLHQVRLLLTPEAPEGWEKGFDITIDRTIYRNCAVVSRASTHASGRGQVWDGCVINVAEVED